MDDLDKQNFMIRKKAKKELIKGLIWLVVAVLFMIGTYENGKFYTIPIIIAVWSFYKMFIASKFYILGRHAVNFPKSNTGPTSSVIKGKIYKNKD